MRSTIRAAPEGRLRPFFALLGKIDPQRATEIHQAKRKPFTLIPLPNKHALRLRVTTLDNALFAPFGAPCGLSLEDPLYMLTRVLATPTGSPIDGQGYLGGLLKLHLRRT